MQTIIFVARGRVERANDYLLFEKEDKAILELMPVVGQLAIIEIQLR